MNTHNLTEHVGWLFGMALNKTNRIDEAEDLVQETFLAALGALEKGTAIENPKNFLSAILNKKFYDRLRQKYRMPTVSINMISEPIQEDTISEEIEKSEEAAEIRKCLASFGLDDYAGLSKIELHNFDCLLGKTNPHEADLPFPMDSIDVMKMLYAIHSGNERDLPIIYMHIFDNIDGFVKMNFLRRDENGKLLCDVPVLKMDELEFLCRLTEKCNKIIAAKFHDEIMPLMKNPVKTPPHLKSVPNFLRYLPCAEGFSMQLILKAHEEGLFLQGIDLEKNPVPAVVLAVCE